MTHGYVCRRLKGFRKDSIRMLEMIDLQLPGAQQEKGEWDAMTLLSDICGPHPPIPTKYEVIHRKCS